MKTVPAALMLLTAFTSVAQARHFGDGRTFSVDCDTGWQSITGALARARDGDTIRVSGTCSEAVKIDKGVTLDGGGSARIVPPDPAQTAISVSARDVTVRGFVLDAPALFQFFVVGASTLIVESNVIRNAQNFGLSVATNSYVVIVDNVIKDNGLGGVIALSGAELAIGMRTGFEPPEPNVIADNGRLGVVLVSRAGARILGGNTISGHAVGVLVQDGAQTRIAGNLIDGNDIGIFVESGGIVQLPLVSNPVPAFTALNSGNNATFGIACKGGTIRGVPDGLAPAVRLPPTPGVLAGPDAGLATHCLDQTESLP